MDIEYTTTRQNMVQNQLRPNKIFDERLLKRMAEVPRELFLPKENQWQAYIDRHVPLTHGRFLIQPLALAQLVQSAKISEIDRVLLIGSGSGYSTFIIAALAGQVYAVDDSVILINQAKENATHFQQKNITFVNTNLLMGFSQAAPYDCIIIEGGVEFIPEELLNQLALDRGRLICVEYVKPQLGRLAILTKHRHGISKQYSGSDVALPLLQSFKNNPAFVF